MERAREQWDFFIAHTGPDRGVSEELYTHLSKDFRVFLDSRSLLPGDDWDVALNAAQRASRITVVIVSSKTEKAYYQREEIAAAIALARSEADTHRVVPVFLDEDYPKDNESIPYGLRSKHSISVKSAGGLEGVSRLLARLLAPTLAMSAQQIEERHKQRSIVEIGVRLIPTKAFDVNGSLGSPQRQYVFIGDYDEQRYRSLTQILSNLLIEDSFEKVFDSNIEWTAICFKIGRHNYRKLDILPATWKAAFRILSHPSRLGCFEASSEEMMKMGPGLKDYLSDDQPYWLQRLRIPERQDASKGSDYLVTEELSISNLCFDGKGITPGTVPSRIFFAKNLPLSALDCRIVQLGFSSDNTILF
jgi:hypothetical protein